MGAKCKRARPHATPRQQRQATWIRVLIEPRSVGLADVPFHTPPSFHTHASTPHCFNIVLTSRPLLGQSTLRGADEERSELYWPWSCAEPCANQSPHAPARFVEMQSGYNSCTCCTLPSLRRSFNLPCRPLTPAAPPARQGHCPNLVARAQTRLPRAKGFHACVCIFTLRCRPAACQVGLGSPLFAVSAAPPPPPLSPLA